MRGFRNYLCIFILRPLTIWFCSPVPSLHVTNRRGRKEQNISFPELSCLCLIHWHSLNFNFVPSLRLHAGGRGKGYRRGQVVKVGKLAGGGRNRARLGVTGPGVRASLHEGAGIGSGQV